MSEKRTVVITISRQISSGGAYIGHLLARKLGYKYVEREILHTAAKELDVEISELSKLDERHTGFLENLIKSFVFGTPEAPYVPPSRRPVYDLELFEAESRIIKAMADRYNAVIVGRGGYFVLRGRPFVLNVFIHAPMDFRIKRFQQFHDVSEKQAHEEIEYSDHQREKFLKTMTDTDRYDARNYHLCINSAIIGFEAAEKIIIGLADKMQKERGTNADL
jgi:CMP/dCMP kinase